MNEVGTEAFGSLNGADAVVTGASRGIGRAFARSLAGAGVRVWMVSEHAAELHDAVGEVVAAGGRVEFRVIDPASAADVTALGIDIRSKTPRLEIVVNAGITDPDLSMTLYRGLLPGLRRDGGTIIEVAPEVTDAAPEVDGAAGVVDDAAKRRSSVIAEAASDRVSVNTVSWQPGADALDEPDALLLLCSHRGEVTDRHFQLPPSRTSPHAR